MSGDSRAARSAPRPSASASARARCRDALIALVGAAACACSADYTLGTLPDPSPIATGARADALVTDGASLYAFSIDDAAFGPAIPLSGCDLEIVEIAQRASGDLYAAGWSAGRAAVYRVSAETGACASVSRFDASAPFALGFVRAANDATERLVADDGGAFALIDTTSGARTPAPIAIALARRDLDLAPAGDGTAWVSATIGGRAVLERVDDTGRTLASFPTSVALEGLAVARGALWGFTADGRVVRVRADAGTITLEPVAARGAPKRVTGASSAHDGSASPR